MRFPTLSASIEELLDLANTEKRGFYTGRYLVTYKQGAHSEAAQSLQLSADAHIARAEDFSENIVDFAALGDAQSLLLPELNVAIVTPADGGVMLNALAADESSPIESFDHETFMFPASDSWRHYLRGFAAASDRIRQDLLGAEAAPVPAPELEFEQEAVAAAATWGLVATRVTASNSSGRGIQIAVLDTGIDLTHPDFADRNIVSASFIPGQTVQDRHGHGTHCIGTACGPRAPVGVPRYGIAYDSQIFAGKVLSNSGSSVGGSVLAGMNWAVANRCQVISMSLSGPGGPFSAFTNAGRAALEAGCLVIAAAGNESRRPMIIAPTGNPANSPTIMSVAAVDESLNVASFSNGGKVEIAGPGVNVFSSWIVPKRYNTISGTSMATPHVAGIAALFAQSTPGLSSRALWAVLTARARHLPVPPRDVGAGLSMAPKVGATVAGNGDREILP